MRSISWGAGRSLRLDLPAGTYRAEWVSTLDGTTARREEIEHSGGAATLSSSPYREDIALRLVKRRK